MKGKTILSVHRVSVILLVIIIGVILQTDASGQELSAAQASVWETVESFWTTWKEKTLGKFRPFYHKNYIHWGAGSTWPHSSSSGDPPAGYLDGLGDVIDSYELTLHDVRVWDNVAVAMYESKVIYMGIAQSFRCTDTWIKETDKWQVIGSIRDSCSTLPKCQGGIEQSSTISATDINPLYEQLPPIGFRYGQTGMPYGEGRHPGIDYEIPIGTSIIAVSEGIIDFIGEPYKEKHWGGGFAVRLKHADDFFSVYVHLSKINVTIGQHIKRGERLGLSGQSNNGYPHLHFGLSKNAKIGSGLLFSESYNPNEFWLDGKPQCFDPLKDYSKNSFKEITFPVACSKSK